MRGGPVRDCGGHRALEVGVAREGQRPCALGELGERSGDPAELCAGLLHGVSEPEAHVDSDLVVTRAAGVEALAVLADGFCQAALHGGVDVLVLRADGPFASGPRGQEAFEPGADVRVRGLVDESCFEEARRVRERARDVVGDEALVHAPVLTDGEGEHARIDRLAAVPDGGVEAALGHDVAPWSSRDFREAPMAWV